MRQVTLANIWAHKSRFIAVSLAVILAVAFMAATLLLGSSTRATLKATLGAEIQNADLVIDQQSNSYSFPLTTKNLAELRKLDEVSEAAGVISAGAGIKTSETDFTYTRVNSALPPGLSSTVLAEGRLPEATDEIVIDLSTANLLGAELNDEVTLEETQKTVVGIAEASKNPFSSSIPSTLVTDETMLQFFGANEESEISFQQILFKLSPGVSIEQARAAIAEIEFMSYEGDPVIPVVSTPDEIVAEEVAMFTSGTDALTAVLMAFVAIALFVAGIVISNTFSVLVAQRSRELALLRCVGASNKQIRRSVLTEAFVMSLVASVLGVLLAVAIMSGLIALAQRFNIAGGVGAFGMNWHAVVWPILVGVLVTLLAASGPAREATRVSPLEAMRSRETEVVSKRAGKIRLTFGLIFFLAGVATIGGGLYLADTVISLALVVLGSILSATGILMLAVFFIPKVAYALGILFFSRRASGIENIPGKLAALNTMRNPKRTGATASALLVGVTLVATVYTGAEVSRATLNNELQSAFPIDLALVTYPNYGGENDELIPSPLNDQDLAGLKNLDGITEVVPASRGFLNASDDEIYEVWGVSPSDFTKVTKVETVTLETGKALIGTYHEDQTEITLTGDAGTLQLQAVTAGAPRYTAIVTPQDFEKISSDNGPEIALIKVDPKLGSADLLELREEILRVVNGSVMGEGIERAMYDDVISMLLLIVTALLAVAIIIAVIGIGNTLSLSVIERTRENALLRALGLTRAGLRWMLAAEALIIAITAAILGVGLGVAYGFAGATAVFIEFTSVSLEAPLLELGIIVALAIVAGLLASVLPARRATKLTPVEGLRSV